MFKVSVDCIDTTVDIASTSSYRGNMLQSVLRKQPPNVSTLALGDSIVVLGLAGLECRHTVYVGMIGG